jgi:RimJ/RimL family protein N-acetyltransferase
VFYAFGRTTMALDLGHRGGVTREQRRLMDLHRGTVLPSVPPSFGDVRLRAFDERDVPMLMDLSTDPYVPAIGTLPANADRAEALAWIGRQAERLATGAGYSFCVADRETDEATGTAGLHLASVAAGRASAGYAVAPRSRGRGIAGQALTALTRFAWSIPSLHRVELYIEPWNVASLRTAERAGYLREGLLHSHQEIAGERVSMVLFAAIRPG